MARQKSYTTKVEELDQQWRLADAENQVLGRFASQIAAVLKGKDKVNYTPHHDNGDFVIVINAEKVKLTGAKLSDKMYHRHSGYMGGIKSKPAERALSEEPESLVKNAVKGMLPRGPLGYKMLSKLKVYSGDSHPHAAQNPTPLKLQ